MAEVRPLSCDWPLAANDAVSAALSERRGAAGKFWSSSQLKLGLQDRVRGSDLHREQERGLPYIYGVEQHKYHQKPTHKVFVFCFVETLNGHNHVAGKWGGGKSNFFKRVLHVIGQKLWVIRRFQPSERVRMFGLVFTDCCMFRSQDNTRHEMTMWECRRGFCDQKASKGVGVSRVGFLCQGSNSLRYLRLNASKQTPFGKQCDIRKKRPKATCFRCLSSFRHHLWFIIRCFLLSTVSQNHSFTV